MASFALGLLALTMVTGVFLGPVTSLPWGLEEPLHVLADTMHLIANVAPWMATVLNVILIGLGVKVTLFIVEKTLWLIQLIRG